jgi:hypothetical protein
MIMQFLVLCISRIDIGKLVAQQQKFRNKEIFIKIHGISLRFRRIAGS